MTLNLGILLKLDKGNVASGAAEAAKSIDGIGDAAERTTAQANRMDAALTTATTAATSGARATITAAGAQTAATGAATKAVAAHGAAMKLTGAQANQLSYQLNDVVVSLASGMNPLTVMLQQGSQITPIFGGIGNTFRALLNVLTPTRVGFGGIAGAALLGAKAAMDHADALRDEAIAVQGLGRNAGLTVGGLEAMARASAKGAGLSISASRGMALEFARTGKIGETEIGGLIGISRDFATTIGSDVTTATKMLGGIFADPAKGADTLYRSLGLIDGGTARLVQRLVDQNRVTEAQIALLAGLKPRLVDSEKDLWFYERAWRAVGTAISDTYGAVGRTLGPKTGDDLLASLEARAHQLRGEIQRSQSVGPEDPYNPMKVFRVQNDGARRELEATEKEIRALRDKAAAERDAAAEAKRRSAQDRAIDRGLTIAGNTPGAIDDRRRLQDEIDRLEEGRRAARDRSFGDETRETPGFSRAAEKGFEEATRGTATALAMRSRALATWISESERARQLAEIDLQMMQAKDPVERAALERKRVLVQLAGQEITETNAAAAANLAYARALGEAVATTRSRIFDLGAEAAARRHVADMVASGRIAAADADRELQIELETRQLVAAAAQKEGAEKQRLIDLASGLRSAYEAVAEQQKRGAAQQSLAAGEDRLETLRTEIALVGQSEAVRTRVLALLEAEQKIRAAGLQGTPEADRMRALAETTAAANTALERQKSAWGEIQTTGGSAIDTLVEGLRTGKDVSKQLADDLSKEMLKLGVANPLKNAIFGQSLPTAGDVGGLLGGLLGNTPKPASIGPFGGSVGTANITAATVIVNGQGLGGLGAAFGDGTGGIGSTGAVTKTPLAPLSLAGNDNGGNARIAGAFGLFDARRAFSAELTDPAVRNRLFAMTEAEVGGQGPAAQQAFMESTFNRASARGMSLDQTLGDRRYFPGSTFSAADRVMGAPRLDTKYGGMLAQVRGGSNLSNYATGNASGTVGFAGGPQTFAAGGERFGIEGPDMSWAKELQASSAQTSQSIAQMGTKSTSVTSEIAGLGSTTTQVGQSLTSSATGITQAGQTLSTSTTSLASGTQGAFSTLLGGLGSGIDAMLTGLTGIIAKIAGAGGGGLFGGLFSGLFGAGGATLATPTLGGLYDTGGFTGIGGRHEPAGVVHRGEYVFDAEAVSRIGVGTLDAFRSASKRGYATGGWVSNGAAMPTRVPSRDATTVQPVFQTVIHNNSSAEITTREEPDGRGGRRQVVVIEEMVGRALTRPGSAARSGLTRTFGAQPVRTKR